MRHCFTTASSAASPSAEGVNHPRPLPGESTPKPSAQPSPTVNLYSEYSRATQSESYQEIWSAIHVVGQWQSHEVNHQLHLLLAQVLQPNHDSVQQVLQLASPDAFHHLASAYFNHSKKTCEFLLLIHQKIHDVRSLYAPIKELVEILPSNLGCLTQSQCSWVFEVFLQFDSSEDPFSFSGFHNIDNMRNSFSKLREEVDSQRRRSSCRLRCIHRTTTGSAICFIGVAVGVAITAVAIASHALVALVAASVPVMLPSRLTKKEVAHMAQLGTASMSAFVLHNHLDTIDRLLARLQDAIEEDKALIRLVLARGKDKHTIHKVVNQLASNHHKVLHQLTDLEEHICLCFTAINRARSRLLEEIDHNQDS